MSVFISLALAGRNHRSVFGETRCLHSRNCASDHHLQTTSLRRTTETGVVHCAPNCDIGMIITQYFISPSRDEVQIYKRQSAHLSMQY